MQYLIKLIKKFDLLSYLVVVVMLMVSCSRDEIVPGIEPDICMESQLEIPLPVTRTDDPLWNRHNNTSLKILAIGNSFTHNATAFLPYLFNTLNGDSVCIATLTYPGCSLRRHWANHSENLEVYSLTYSDAGEWKQSLIKTLDEAILMLDWDIITLQQDSGNSGEYATYQPHLENLESLIRAVKPECKLVWNVTWCYTSDCLYEEFSRYDYDWEKMYHDILEAGSKASEYCDMTINSATLIKDMRETFPEITDGFSSDGRHITDVTAQYALSSLLYEALIAPEEAISCFDKLSYPSGVNAELMPKINSIIRNVIDNPIENEGNSVPLIQQ